MRKDERWVVSQGTSFRELSDFLHMNDTPRLALPQRSLGDGLIWEWGMEPLPALLCSQYWRRCQGEAAKPWQRRVDKGR
jgi:hypothetical protein